MTFLNREKTTKWLWGICFLLAVVLIVLAVIYRRLQAERPNPVWWQAVANNLDRQAVFISIDNCAGLLYEADCRPGHFSSDLSLVGRSFVDDTHYQQWHRDLIEQMVSPSRQTRLAEFKSARKIEFWGLVFDIQIEPGSAAYFRSRLVAGPNQINLASDLAAAGLISSDQLEILEGGWYRYDSPPQANLWLDWAEVIRPFFYGRLDSQLRQEFVDQLRRQGVYQFIDEDVNQFPVELLPVGNPQETAPLPPPAIEDGQDREGPAGRFYEYQVDVGCRQLFEAWPDYLAAIGRADSQNQAGVDRCDGPNATVATDRLYDYDLTVSVDIDQRRIVSFGQYYQDEFFTRQTLSHPDQTSPWGIDPGDSDPEANFDDHVSRLLPAHDN